MRHAHMVNINRRIMLEGMRADFNHVDALSSKVLAIVSQAKEITGKTAAGCNFTGTLNPEYRWIKTSGIISRDKWGNLPGGEIFTSPGEVNGVYVVDGVVGDYLCDKYGDLEHQPLTIRIKDNRIKEVFSENKALEQEFWSYTHTDENSDRVGEFAIGTNIELTDVIGADPAGREVPRHSHCLWQSLRGTHWGQVVLRYAHRRGRTPI
jgi:leucyl aminopeptidase (aminopeptidase T)